MMKRFLFLAVALTVFTSPVWAADDQIQSAASGTSELAYRFPRGYTGGHYVEPATEDVTVRIHVNGAVKYRYTAYASNSVFVPVAGDSLYIVRGTATAVKTVFVMPGGLVVPGGATNGATTDTNTDSLDAHQGKIYYQLGQIDDHVDGVESSLGSIGGFVGTGNTSLDAIDTNTDSLDAHHGKMYYQITNNSDSYGHKVSPDKGTITVTSGDTITSAETFSAFIGGSRWVQVRFLASANTDTTVIEYGASSTGATDLSTGDAAWFDLDPTTSDVIEGDTLFDVTGAMTPVCLPVATRYGGTFVMGDYLLIRVTPVDSLNNCSIVVDKLD